LTSVDTDAIFGGVVVMATATLPARTAARNRLTEVTMTTTKQDAFEGPNGWYTAVEDREGCHRQPADGGTLTERAARRAATAANDAADIARTERACARQFLALPSTVLASAQWRYPTRAPAGGAWAALRHFVAGGSLDSAILLRADHDEWRYGVTIGSDD
jgi:hypothetical protein